MIAHFLHLSIAPEPDRAWFTDHGRRRFRWRPCKPNESGMSVIAQRQGPALIIPVAPHPGLWDADDEVLSALFAAYASLRKEAERSATPGPV